MRTGRRSQIPRGREGESWARTLDGAADEVGGGELADALGVQPRKEVAQVHQLVLRELCGVPRGPLREGGIHLPIPPPLRSGGGQQRSGPSTAARPGCRGWSRWGACEGGTWVGRPFGTRDQGMGGMGGMADPTSVRGQRRMAKARCQTGMRG